MNISLKEQTECLNAEYRRRQKFYPLLVESGKMTRDESIVELAQMDAARKTLSQLLGLTKGQPFDE